MKKLVLFFLMLTLFIYLFPFDPTGANSENVNIKIIRIDNTIIDTLNFNRSNSNGLEFDGRYFYLVNTYSNPGNVYRIDYVYGIIDSFTMPTTGYIFGIGIVGERLYISDWTNGTIRKITKNGIPVTTFISPGGVNTRGVTSDGKNLYIASTAGYIFVTDTLINIIDTIHISSVIGWPMDMAYCEKDSTLWVLDNISEYIKQLDISVDPPVILDSFPNPEMSNYGEGVAFDGNDLWISTYYGTSAYRFDLGFAKTRVAYFENHAPWGSVSNEDIFYKYNIAFHHFNESEIGLVDLSRFQKCIFASQQERSFYEAISNNKIKYEDWVNSGGILQINGATYSSYDWSGIEMPFGFTMASRSTDSVAILNGWHPLLNEFSKEDSTTLVNWNSVSHGGLINLPENSYVVLLSADSIDTLLLISRQNKGGIIATTMPIEYAYYNVLSKILENVDMYWVYGNYPNILWAVADENSPKIIKQIEEYPDFGNIDYMNAAIYLPNSNDLSFYDMVITYPDNDYLDKIAIGDTLLSFVNSGKWVITGGFSWYYNGNNLEGGIMDSLINPFRSLDGNNHYSFANLGNFVAGHPFMNNVTTLRDEFRDYLILNTGADSVARWDDGEWLLGYRNLPQPAGGVIGLNMFPSDWSVMNGILSGDYVELLHNLFKASELTNVEEISKEKTIDLKTKVSTITSNIFYANFSEQIKGKINLNIYDKNGRVLKTLDFNGTHKEIVVDLKKEKFSSDIYFFKLETPKNVVKGKFLFITK
ncbi:MAG: hypothetical protein ABIN05_06640 [candidate division WOR-3 bacterium]